MHGSQVSIVLLLRSLWPIQKLMSYHLRRITSCYLIISVIDNLTKMFFSAVFPVSGIRGAGWPFCMATKALAYG